MSSEPRNVIDYVGTLVGESSSTEFRLAVAHEAVREQDIVAVDASLRHPDSQAVEEIRIWAKVREIERLNPLFPAESGHELAATRTHPLDTVLSFSREMVTAVCQVLGWEPKDGSGKGRLDHLRYPAQPASSAYRPSSGDLARIVLGDMNDASKSHRGLDLATLSNRATVTVKVDGHAVVSRHLAVLAMTGAGKSWTARRIIEQLAAKHYPIVIFDPHGDYAGLAKIDSLREKVRYYSAEFPLFDEDADRVAEIVESIGYTLSPAMHLRFGELFRAATQFYSDEPAERQERERWLSTVLADTNIVKYGIKPDMWLMANLAQAAQTLIQSDNAAGINDLESYGWQRLSTYSKTDARTLEGISKRARKAASALARMATVNKRASGARENLPTDRAELVQYGQVTVVSLAGYTGDFQAAIYTMIADDLFSKRVTGELKLPVLCILEEAHNFAPAQAYSEAEKRSILTTRQIAQEGRKFGMGLILISQRPSRLDETTLSQCNSQVIMRMINPADQNFVKRVVESLGDSDIRMLSGLDVGEAILAGQMINFPVLCRIKPPESRGEREETDAFAALAAVKNELDRSGRG